LQEDLRRCSNQGDLIATSSTKRDLHQRETRRSQKVTNYLLIKMKLTLVFVLVVGYRSHGKRLPNYPKKSRKNEAKSQETKITQKSYDSRLE